MNNNQQIAINTKDSIPINERTDEWSKNWKECLKRILLKEMNVQHMFYVSVKTGNESEVVKRGDEVIEVRNENENEVELMIVNVKNHSMRVLRGSEGEELIEMNLSELKENEIIDLNDDGMDEFGII